MLTLLRKSSFKPNTLTQNSFTTNLIRLPVKSQINIFSSPLSSNSVESEPKSTLFDKRKVKSNQLISLFKAQGFTETQISKLSRARPQILYLNTQKIIAPKIEFLRSIGISNTDLPFIVTANPNLLQRSLENQLIPCYTYLKSILIHDENVVKMLKRSSWIILGDFKKTIAPNITLLNDIGVPKSVISFMLLRFPALVLQNKDKLKRNVEDAIRIGFNPVQFMFVEAVRVLCEMSKMTLDRKWNAYRMFGLSDDEILIAFKAYPKCMMLSEEKIRKGMEFLVNKMGWEAVRIAKCPISLFYSMENRIIPRCRVIEVLISKGILKKEIGFCSFLGPVEKEFLKKYVSKYEFQIPELLNVYLGQTGCLEKGNGCKDSVRLCD